MIRLALAYIACVSFALLGVVALAEREVGYGFATLCLSAANAYFLILA